MSKRFKRQSSLSRQGKHRYNRLDYANGWGSMGGDSGGPIITVRAPHGTLIAHSSELIKGRYNKQLNMLHQGSSRPVKSSKVKSYKKRYGGW